MSTHIHERKCKHCMDIFTPDPRNTYHQEYCSKPECRKASKKASQAKWLGKPENQNYFSGPTNVQRMKDWRKAHPGPRPRKTSCNRNVLLTRQINVAIQDRMCYISIHGKNRHEKTQTRSSPAVKASSHPTP